MAKSREEILKLLPLLLYFLIFEPDSHKLTPAAIGIAVGFATFENVCYLTENGAGQIVFLLIRGFGTGAMHVVCGSAYSEGLRFVWKNRLLRDVCIPGILCVTIIYHAIYNLLVSVGGTCQLIGYCIPLLTLVIGLGIRRLARKK